MAMTLEIRSSYLKLKALIIAVVLLYGCNSEPQNEVSFYHAQRVLEKHTFPVFATLKNGAVLEDSHSFEFDGEEIKKDFRFRTSYFDVKPNSNTQIEVQEAKEINIQIIENTLRLEKNTIYSLNHPLYIDSGATLVFEEGSQLYIDNAIDIISKGNIVVQGEKENPVLISALKDNWGGISSVGGKIDIAHLILTKSGGNDSIKVRHSFSQPAISMVEDGEFTASNLYIINCLGKALYIKRSFVKIKKSLLHFL